MPRIRFLQLGTENNTLIHNLVVKLNRIQNTYEFLFEDEILQIPPETHGSDGKVLCQHLEQMTRDFIHAREYTGYTIAVTGVPLVDDLAYSADTDLAVLSTSEWSSFSRFPATTGMMFETACVLLDRVEVCGVHDSVTMECPNDFCNDRRDVDRGIVKAELCDQCKHDLLEGLEKGKLGLADAIAIHRILDAVADRKMCFVLMPFRKEFEESYQVIKAAVEGGGYTVRRADEIHETRSIMQIICEQIGRADLLVADLTDRNPNVFYELGYAHALGKNTILVTRRADDVPFDLRHRQYVLYDPGKLGTELAKPVSAYLYKGGR